MADDIRHYIGKTAMADDIRRYIGKTPPSEPMAAKFHFFNNLE